MKSPRDKYFNDARYAQMVNMMVGSIHQCKLTPSELREMALLASILYEESQMQMVHCISEKENHLKVVEALKVAWDWVCPAKVEIGKI